MFLRKNIVEMTVVVSLITYLSASFQCED